MDTRYHGIPLMELPSELIRATVDMTDPIDRTVLSYVSKSFAEMVRGRGICPDIACDTAAAAGKLELLQWLYVEGFLIGSSTCEEAARNGHLEILKWLRSVGCTWNSYITCNAAESGRIDVIKWLRDNGVPMTTYMGVYAARKGHLHVIKWLHKRGLLKNIDSVVRNAAADGHQHIIWWLANHGYIIESAAVFAAQYGRVDLFVALIEAGMVQKKNAIEWFALKNCSVVELKRLLSLGCYIDYNQCSNVISYGRLDVLQWLILDLQYTPDSDLCFTALKYGREDIFNWLVSIGQIPPNIPRYAHAAYFGRIDILRGLPDDECQFDEKTGDVVRSALESNNIQVVEWFLDRGYKPIEWDIRMAIRNNQLNVLKMMHKHVPICFKPFRGDAVDNQRLEILRWMHSVDGDIFTGMEYDLSDLGCKTVIKWMIDKGFALDKKFIDYCRTEYEYEIIDWLKAM